MKIAYYPGCTLKTTAQNFEDSAIEAAKVLGIEFVELPKWNCCGTVFSLTEDDLIHHVAPIRLLVRVQEMAKSENIKQKLVTLCSMCYNTLKRANLRMKEKPEDLEKINNFMNREEEYEGKVEVLHFLEMLRSMGFSKIRNKVKKPLTGLKLAPYYGCMMLRPKGIGIDDPEDPTIQADLLKALGAEVADTPYKKLCCGSYQTVRDKYATAELAYDILTNCQKAGAEAIITSCPLCAFNLDNRQDIIKKAHPGFEQIPVFYFTQLMALAFGVEENKLGLDRNATDPKPLLYAKKLLKKK